MTATTHSRCPAAYAATRPARERPLMTGVGTALATTGRFLGHFALAGVSVLVLGSDTEH